MRDWRLVEFAKKMRREQTDPEVRLWFQLRAARFHGIKFRRQKVVGRYIADFSARDPMVVVEVDGDTHGFQEDYDRTRTAFFEEQGYRVIRFTNSDVMTNMEGVLTQLSLFVGHSPLLPPLRGSLLSPEGERASFPLSPSGERVGERGTQE